MNCQLEKTDEYIDKNVRVLKYIIENLPHLHVILQGFPFDSIHKLGSIINNVHFVDAVPLNLARNHIKIDTDYRSTKSMKRDQTPFLPLLLHNIDARKRQLENSKKRILQSPLRKAG